MIKEACIESLEEALRAERLGADRVELCANLEVGGTTPSYGLISSVVKNLKIPVMVMIRPRGGDFVYSSMELKMMEQNIRICSTSGVKGIVLGILDPHGHINLKSTQKLIDLARPMDITFHKAIDVTADILGSIEELKELEGLTRVLSSGGASTAGEGKEMLNKMIDAADYRFSIMAAGRITNENLPHLSSEIHTDEFHGRKIVGNLNKWD